MMEYLVRRDIASKRWDMTVAGLSHTPMTKEAARSSQENFRSIDRTFDRILMRMRAAKDRGKKEIKSEYKVILEPGESMPEGM